MRALSGIRILDLTHMLSGPYAGMMLADLGAETIKVEPPGTGEGTRKLQATDPRNSVHGMGSYFLTLNRNKRSVTLNLKSEDGRALFYDLVRISDVVLNNFGAGVPERLKIDYAHLCVLNPRVITCSITGFGETGPGRDWAAFDMVAQAMGGGMSITGEAGGTPMRAGIPIGDLGGGLFGVVGVLAALAARATTGRGQHVDISMLDGQISLLNYMATMWFLNGEIPQPIGNSHFVHVPYNTFPAQDGFLIIAAVTDDAWKGAASVLGLAELDTAENAVQPGRAKNRDLINRRVGERTRTNTKDYWIAKLRAARVPCAPVNNFAEALTNEQVLARHMVIETQHPAGDRLRMPGNPIKLSETHEDTFTAPPLLGQHNAEVYRNLLGKSAEELAALEARGVI